MHNRWAPTPPYYPITDPTMPPKRSLTPIGDRIAQRATILALYDSKLTNKEIHLQTGFAKSTISNVIKEWGPPEKRGNLGEKPKSGRPRIITPRFVEVAGAICNIFGRFSGLRETC